MPTETANFHLGRYNVTLSSFRSAAAEGEPISAVSLAYQAAALHGHGRMSDGEDLVEELMATWPRANVAVLFGTIYADKSHAANLTDRLFDLGWEMSGE